MAATVSRDIMWYPRSQSLTWPCVVPMSLASADWLMASRRLSERTRLPICLGSSGMAWYV